MKKTLVIAMLGAMLHAALAQSDEATSPVVTVSGTSAQEAEEGRELILPDDLTQESLLDALGEETALQIAPDLRSLYDSAASAEDRLAAAERLRSAGEALPWSSGEDGSVRRRLLRRVRLVESGLKAEQSVADDAEAVASVRDLIAAANNYEMSSSVEDAAAVRSAYGKLRKSSPAARQALLGVMMSDYFNHNIHITVSEPMVARLVNDSRQEAGGVADCILGAWVTGSQVTNTHVSADIRPSSNTASFHLVVNGTTTSNTTGVKDPVTVYTQGNHYFTMRKPVYFDGYRVTSGQATIDVNTNNRTLGFRTKYDKLPIIRHFVRKIAAEEIAKKKGQSEAVAAQRLAGEALPKFEEEAGTRFASANRSIDNDLMAPLRERGIAPESVSARSTNSHIAVSSRTMGDGRLGGSAQPFSPVPLNGLALQLHESALNNGIDGLQFEGKEVPEDELVQEFERSLSELLRRDIKLGDGLAEATETVPAADSDAAEEGDDEADSPATFIFNDKDPIRVRFNDGQILIALRTGVRQEGKDDVPQQLIEIPISVQLAGDKLLLTPPEKLTDIKVAPAEPAPRIRQIARANQIRRLLRNRLKPREVDTAVEVPVAETGKVTLNLNGLTISDGWVTAEMQ